MTQINDLADQLAADLIAASTAEAFLQPLAIVERRHYVIRKPKDLAAGNVLTIAAAGETGTRETQTKFKVELAVQMALRVRVPDYSEAQLDELDELAAQLFDYWDNRLPTGRGEAMMTKEWVALFDVDDLLQHNVYTAVMQFNFQGWR